MDLTERALTLGVESLNKMEQLSLLTGIPVSKLENKIDFTNALSLSDLKITEKQALKIKLLNAILKAYPKERYTRAQLNSPQIVAEMFMNDLQDLPEEHFYIALLDTKCCLIETKLISKGILSASSVHPREVFRSAIAKPCYTVLALHNHPSGDPTPSEADILLTKRLRKSGEIIGIHLMDHVIIGKGRYVSLKEEGYL